MRNFKRLPAIPRVPVFPPLIPAMSVCVCVCVCLFLVAFSYAVTRDVCDGHPHLLHVLPALSYRLLMIQGHRVGPLKQNGHLSCPLISQPSPLESILTFHSALIEGNGAFRGCYR